MKDGKNITLKKLTADYIVSAIVWGLLSIITLVPISEIAVENITLFLLGKDSYEIMNSNNIFMVISIVSILSTIFSIIIYLCINLVATNSALNKVQSIDEKQSQKFINNVSVFWIIVFIISSLLTLYLNNMTWYGFISNAISTFSAILIIRKKLNKELTKLN